MEATQLSLEIKSYAINVFQKDKYNRARIRHVF